MSELKPFADDAHVLTVGDLTVENGLDALTVTGELVIRRDREGLAAARALAEAFADAVHELSGMDLPERAAIPEGDGGGVVDNPFGTKA